MKTLSIPLSSIPRLFFLCRPMTVFKTVITIRVYAINTSVELSKLFNVLSVGIKHVLSKFFIGVPKAFDATSAIVDIGGLGRNIASSFDTLKYLVKSSTTFFVGSSEAGNCITSQTTTRFGVFGSKPRTKYLGFIATITETFPKNMLWFAGKLSQNQQTRKSFSGKVFGLGRVLTFLGTIGLLTNFQGIWTRFTFSHVSLLTFTIP